MSPPVNCGCLNSVGGTRGLPPRAGHAHLPQGEDTSTTTPPAMVRYVQSGQPSCWPWISGTRIATSATETRNTPNQSSPAGGRGALLSRLGSQSAARMSAATPIGRFT